MTPIHSRDARRIVLGTLCALLGTFALTAASARAESLYPWWHLASSSQPTYLDPGQAKDDVERLTVSATSGGFSLYASGHDALEQRDFSVGEAPSQVQETLEEPELYGTGNVEVTGGPGPEHNNPYEIYEIKFVGKRAYTFVESIDGTGPESVGEVSGGRKIVEATTVVEGRPDGLIVLTATNLGDAAVNPEGQPVSITDKLPSGLEAVWWEGIPAETVGGNSQLNCSHVSVACMFTLEENGFKSIEPYSVLTMRIGVNVKGSPDTVNGELNEANIAGGGAAPVSISAPVTVSSLPVPFAVHTFEMRAEEAGGRIDTQAGSHPFQFTTTLDFNEQFQPNGVPPPSGKFIDRPIALAKDLSFKLPAGLIGNPSAVSQCTLGQFTTNTGGYKNACPSQTAIGVARVDVSVANFFGSEYAPIVEPLFNLEPAPGEPARFGFDVYNNPVILDTAVRSGEDYGVTVNVDNITQAAGFIGSEVTFWGVPGDPRHDAQRGWGCMRLLIEESKSKRVSGYESICNHQEEVHPPPFLSLPTSCNGPLSASVEGDTWEQWGERKAAGLPAQYEHMADAPLPEMDGCNRLQFAPEIKVTPDEDAASEPSGLTVDVHVPQEVNGTGSGFDSSDVKNITVQLPEGVVLNPSAGDGLQACSEAQIGFEGFKELNPAYEPGVRTMQFSDQEASCPNASKIANVTIHSPLLPNAVQGFVYLAAPQNFTGQLQENPFESLVAMYLVAKDPVSGTLVKLAGKVELNEATGQILSTFENSPELAFEDAEISFFGGERAPLATPARCGSYTTQASFAPWSAGPSADSSSRFEITSGPYGSACPGSSLPFSPSLSSGTTNINAGGFTPLTTTLSREDGQQGIQSVVLHYPAGVSGLLSGVKLCGEAQANAGTCGPESEIGETIVSVGLGGDPYTVTGGKVYITEKYAGAPFGLSIVNPAKAGPFDLQQGRPVVVRAKIEVNPINAALTITTDPSGAHAIPHTIEGIALQIKHVNVTIDRPGFTFNPTNCDPTAITGAINADEGASSPVSVPFQVTNCKVLAFNPGFKVSTSGKTSRSNGASLAVKLTYPSGAMGKYANIAKVKVDLPKQLPSRLTTLQKACTNATFEANPANCPADSRVGQAKAITPLIPVPLEGPAIFVSHGGAKFPELIIVLQGYGVTLDLHGETFISKAGITSSTFSTVPDAPVGSFELNLPEGSYSALAANGNLCKSTLKMPTAFTAQNGAEIHESTPVTVTGCPKQKAHKARKANKKRGKGAKKR
jgi:hypothetical protein